VNPIIQRHYDAIEAHLLQSQAVVSYQIQSREIGFSDGKLRFKAVLSDGGTVECFEYITVIVRRDTLFFADVWPLFWGTNGE